MTKNHMNAEEQATSTEGCRQGRAALLYSGSSIPSSSHWAAQACQHVCTSWHCCLQELSHAQEALTREQQRSQQQALEVGQLTKALAEATAKAAHQARQHAMAAQELEDVSLPPPAKGSTASDVCACV